MSTVFSLAIIYFVQRHLVNYQFVKSIQQNCNSDWLDDLLFRAQILANDFHKVPMFVSCTLFILALALLILLIEGILYYFSGQFGLFLFSFIVLFYCFAAANKKEHRSMFVSAFENKFCLIFWFALLGIVGSVLYLLCNLYGLKHNSINSNIEKAPDFDNNVIVNNSVEIDNLDLDIANVEKFKLKKDAQKAINEIYFAASINNCLFTLHKILAWLPARISGLIFILVGNFDKGFNAWKNSLLDWTMPHTKVVDLCANSCLGDKNNVEHALLFLDRAFVAWIIFCIIIKLMI